MTNFRAHHGIIYLNTVPISADLTDALLEIFAREGAVDLVADLSRVRREIRIQQTEIAMERENGL